MSFSALQRAEIAETLPRRRLPQLRVRFSALQRAEIAETETKDYAVEFRGARFSALQRAEIAESPSHETR